MVKLVRAKYFKQINTCFSVLLIFLVIGISMPVFAKYFNPDGTRIIPENSSFNPLSPGDIINSFPAQGSSPRGITFDGVNLWTTDSDGLMIYQVHPLDGHVIKSFGAPDGFPADMAWDGVNLWNTDPSSDVIYKISPSDGNVLDSFPSPGSGPNGLAWDGVNLWSADWETTTIYKIDPSNGAILDSFPSPSSGLPYGLAWDGSFLWHADYFGSILYKINPSNGAVVDSVPTPSPNPAGLAWDGQYIWYVDGTQAMVYQIDVDGLPLGTINGTVTDADTGDSIKWALVIAVQEPTKVRTFTKPDGYYELADLQEGDWWVIVIKRGYKAGIAKVTVESGKTTTKDFMLTKKE